MAILKLNVLEVEQAIVELEKPSETSLLSGDYLKDIISNLEASSSPNKSVYVSELQSICKRFDTQADRYQKNIAELKNALQEAKNFSKDDYTHEYVQAPFYTEQVGEPTGDGQYHYITTGGEIVKDVWTRNPKSKKKKKVTKQKSKTKLEKARKAYNKIVKIRNKAESLYQKITNAKTKAEADKYYAQLLALYPKYEKNAKIFNDYDKVNEASFNKDMARLHNMTVAAKKFKDSKNWNQSDGKGDSGGNGDGNKGNNGSDSGKGGKKDSSTETKSNDVKKSTAKKTSSAKKNISKLDKSTKKQQKQIKKLKKQNKELKKQLTEASATTVAVKQHQQAQRMKDISELKDSYDKKISDLKADLTKENAQNAAAQKEYEATIADKNQQIENLSNQIEDMKKQTTSTSEAVVEQPTSSSNNTSSSQSYPDPMEVQNDNSSSGSVVADNSSSSTESNVSVGPSESSADTSVSVEPETAEVETPSVEDDSTVVIDDSTTTTTSSSSSKSSGGSIIPGVLGVAAAGAATVAGVRYIKNKDKDNYSVDEYDEDDDDDDDYSYSAKKNDEPVDKYKAGGNTNNLNLDDVDDIKIEDDFDDDFDQELE
ncbi:MAG: hypothetical protein E7160_04480 [Firmicutes bacterium]|nr:hypothetical protein [Bacillota bacterium]